MGRSLFRALIARGFARLPGQTVEAQAPARRMLLERLEDRLLFDAGPVAPVDVDAELAQAQASQAAMSLAASVAEPAEVRLIAPMENVADVVADLTRSATNRGHELIPGTDSSGSATVDGTSTTVIGPHAVDASHTGAFLSSGDVSRQLLTTSDELRSELQLAVAGVRRELIFVDTTVEDYLTLLADVDPRAEVFLLDANRDGVEQILEVLSQRNDVDAVHIVSHGRSGELRLGNAALNLESMHERYAEPLGQIGQFLSADADILIYGCNFAEGLEGMAAADSLAQLTGADVAASTNATGSAALGGDWILERNVGAIESNIAFGVQIQRAWQHLLAKLDWDVVDWTSGSLSQSYSVEGGTVSLAIAGSTSRFQSGSPDDNTTNTGGLSPVEESLFLSVDYQAQTVIGDEAITTTINFSHPGGVANVSFSIFDIDNGGFTDQIIVTGNNGSMINPSSVSVGSAATFDGVNKVTGIASNSSTSANGTAAFTFNQSGITQITIVYQSGQLANPSQQFISLHDINFSAPPILDLDASGAGTGFSTTFTEDGPAVAIADTDSLITDSDSANLTRATITLTNPQASDLLSVSGALPSGISLDPSSTSSLIVLTGSSSLANYETAIEQIRFSNSSQNPSTTARSITLIVRDDTNLTSNSATTTVTVVAVNDAPTTANNTVTTAEDTPFTFSSGNFPFSDVDGDSLQSVRITSLPATGSLRLSGVAVTVNQVIPVASIGNLVFTPVLNGNGSPYTTFGFQVSDGTDISSTATQTVNVTPENDTPTGGNHTVTTAEDTDFVFSTSDFPFSDVDGDSLARVRIDTLPADGTVVLAGVAVTAGQIISVASILAGNLKFSPDLNENGSPYTTFTFSVGDASLFATSPSTTTVNVTPVNDPPIASGTIPDQSSNDAQVVSGPNISGFFSDIDVGDSLTFSASGLPSGLSVHPTTGLISGTINRSASLTSPYSVTITATDTGNLTATRSFSWTVTNPAPTATNNTASVTEDGPTFDTGNVLIDDDGFGADSDPDGDPLTVSAVNGSGANVGVAVSGTYGSLTVASGGGYTYLLDNSLPAVQALNDGQTLTDSFTYTITDSEGGTSTATLTVTINGMTDAPAIGASVVVSKGIVASDNSNATFNSAVGPVSATFQSPGSAISFSGSITSNDLALAPVNANVSTVDASDLVRFSIDLQNLGNADAFDVRLQDLLPAGYQIPSGGLGLNLVVTDGNGNVIRWRGLDTNSSSDLFGSGIELLDATAVYLMGDGGNVTTRMSDRNNFDPATNEETLGPWINGTSIESLAMHPMTGVLYGSDNNNLGTIDRTTGEYTVIGSGFGTADGDLGSYALDSVNGLSFHPTTLDLFGVHKRSGPDLLFKIDPTTGAFIADAFGVGRDYIPLDTDAAGVGSDIDDIAFDPSTGNLYATMSDRLILITLDEVAGTSTIIDIGAFGSGINDMEGLSFDRDGNLWGTTGANNGAESNQLWEIDKITGAASNPRPLDNDSDYEGLVIDGPGLIGAIRSLTHATSAGDGSNVIVLTYDLQLTSAVAPLQTITNTATLTNYSATDYGSDLTTVDPTETALTTIATAATAKSLLGSGINSASNSASQATIGEAVQYQVTITVPEGTLPSSVVFDNLDEGLQFVSLDSIAALSGGNPSGAITSSVGAFSSTALFAPTVTGTGAAGSPQSLTFDLGTLTNSNTDNSASETLVLTYTVRVANIAENSGNGAAVGTLRNNVAHFEWTANSATQVSSTAGAVSLEIVEPILEVAKTVNDSTPNLGDVVTYSLTLTHSATSDTDAFDVRLLDTLPTGTTLNLGSISVTGATITANVSAGDTLDVTLDTVPFGSTVTLTYTATVTSNVGDLGMTLPNPVTATWTSLPGPATGERSGEDPENIDNYARSSTQNSTVVNPALSVTIDNAAASVSAGQTFAYSLVVTNDGDSAATGIVVTGSIPLDRLNFLSTDDAANFSIDGSGNFTWTPAVASLAASDTLVLTLTVQVPSSLAAGIDEITVTANVTHGNIEPTPVNNSDNDTDLLIAAPDLSLTKSDGDITVNPGDSVVYTLSYTNSGTQEATGVFINESVPTNSSFNAAASTVGWIDLGGGNYRFNVGAVAAGASGNILFAVNVNSSLPAGVTQLSNSATIADDTTNGTDPSGDNTGSDTTTLDAAPDYSVTISNGVGFVTEGQSLSYTVNFANSGNQDGTGVFLTATFPTEILENVTASGGGLIDIVAGTITWNVGSLAAGANGSFTVTADVRDPVPGGTTTLTLSAAITDDGANGADATPANNSDDDTDSVITNFAPTGADSSVTTAEDTDFVFALSDFPYSDPDSDPLAEVRIDSLPVDGTLLLNGVAVNANDVIAAADIASGRLVFRPDLNENGSPYTTFAFKVGDGTDFAASSNTMTVHVTPVNDAPNGGDFTVTTPEDTDFVFTLSAFPFSDVDGDPLTRVRIDSLPAAGTLLFNGVPVSPNDMIDAVSIAGGLLLFRPTANENGSPYTTFDFSVGDASSFVVSSSTMTVNVTPTTVSVTKSLFDSSDPNTIGSNVTIGEELCFALLVTMSEGNSTDLVLTDLLPDGLQYSSWTLITTAAASNGLLAADFNGSVPAPNVSGGTFDGEDVTFDFGPITVWADGNAANNSFVLLVHAFVTDVPSNHDPLAGTPVLTNIVTADVSNSQPPVSSNPFDVTVVEPDLSVTIDNGVATLTAGQTTTYSITITNDGDSLATGVVLNGSLPIDRVTFVASDDAVNFNIDGSGTFVWTPAIASLAPGGTLTLLLTVQVNAMQLAGIEDVTIPVSVTHNNIEPTPANNSAADTDTLNAAPDLRLTKTDFTNSISPGQGSVYTLNVGNVGTQAATNVLVTESIPVGTTFNPLFSDPAWTNVGGNVYQFAIANLPARASFNVNFSVLINNPAVAGQEEIVNTATIVDDGTNGPDLDPSNNTATDTNALDAVPMYDIGVDDLQVIATPGESLTYFVNFNNYGLQNGTGVVLSANFPTAILTNVVASDGGIVDAVAGTITWNVGALSANDPRTFTVTADVRSVIPSGLNDVTLSASITDDGANGPDPDLSDNSASDTDTLAAQPDYAITIDDGETLVRPGDPLTYTINVANNGNQDGNGVVVTVSFPTTILENVVASNGGIVDAVAGTITWNLGDLASGESTALTVDTQVRNNVGTQTSAITLTATVTDDGLNGSDPTPQNNSGRDIDRLQVYAYDSFHDWKEMRFGFLTPQQPAVGRPLAPLPVEPVFSGLTEPGSTLVARIFGADGRMLGDRQVIADSAGNWLVSFPNLIIYEYPHRMEIVVTPAIGNLAHENGFNLRRYFHPAIHAGLTLTEPLSIPGVFRNRAYNIVEAQHSANTHPLGFEWYSHAYELNAASSNVSQR